MFEKVRKKSPCKVIAVVAQKGGVGKTFVATSLAINAAIGGPSQKLPRLKVLVLDVDSQQNISYLFLKALGAMMLNKKCRLPPNPRCPKGEIYNITDMIYGNDWIEYPTQFDNLDIIPSDGMLDQLRMESDELRKYSELDLMNNTSKIFKEIIDILSESYDLIVIDTPPAKTHASMAALSASTHAVVVCQLHNFSTEMSVPSVMSDIEYSNTSLKGPDDQTEIIGIVPNQISKISMTNTEKRNHNKLLDEYPDYYSSDVYFTNRVSFNISIPQNIDTFDWIKDKVAKGQMAAFYKSVAQKSLIDIYKETMEKQ
jgi:chromosome partitioning protein